MGNKWTRFCVISLMFISFPAAWTRFSLASLGGDAESVVTDGDALAAHRHSTLNRGPYSVTELRTPSMRVREFLTTDGKVFAIAWEGLTQPDLSKLLGSLYGEFQKESLRPAAGHRQIHSFESERMVVRSSGHMRHHKGIAYLRALVPAGVDIHDVQ